MEYNLFRALKRGFVKEKVQAGKRGRESSLEMCVLCRNVTTDWCLQHVKRPVRRKTIATHTGARTHTPEC